MVAAPVLYENGVPQHLLDAMAELYQSAFCLPEYFAIHKSAPSPSVLVIEDELRRPRQILAYRRSGRRVSLLNEFLSIEPPDLCAFAAALFNRYPELERIDLSRVACETEHVGYPRRLWSASNDVVIELPTTVEEYDDRLGKNTRKNVKYYLNRIRREHDDFVFRVASGAEIDAGSVARIVEMNRQRMQSRHGIESGIDAELEARIQSFARRRGLVSTISVDNRVIAGIVCYEIGSHCFGEVIAHDPAFDKSRVGQVCFYLTLQHLIGKGARYYHTLEGENDYKYRFLGSNRPLDSFTIYRSRVAKLRDLPDLARFRSAELAKKLKYWTTKHLIRKFSRPMIFTRLRNALKLLCGLDFREFLLHARMALGQVDLGNVSTEELQLSPQRSSYYSNSGGAQLDGVLSGFRIGPDDAVIDFGCGKGGALITLAKYPFKRILGVEISGELAEIARSNFRKLGIEGVELAVCDATEFSDLDGFNYLYFFNPFPCAVMREVMANVSASLSRVPRKVTIIYLNPACHEAVVENTPFAKVGEFPHHLHAYYIYSNAQSLPGATNGPEAD